MYTSSAVGSMMKFSLALLLIQADALGKQIPLCTHSFSRRHALVAVSAMFSGVGSLSLLMLTSCHRSLNSVEVRKSVGSSSCSLLPLISTAPDTGGLKKLWWAFHINPDVPLIGMKLHGRLANDMVQMADDQTCCILTMNLDHCLMLHNAAFQPFLLLIIGEALSNNLPWMEKLNED